MGGGGVTCLPLLGCTCCGGVGAGGAGRTGGGSCREGEDSGTGRGLSSRVKPQDTHTWHTTHTNERTHTTRARTTTAAAREKMLSELKDRVENDDPEKRAIKKEISSKTAGTKDGKNYFK
jgi:hypothetical protein